VHRWNTGIIFLFALTGILVLVLLTRFILKEAIPSLLAVGGTFFTSPYWYPTCDPPEFGMLAMIVDSLLVTLLSSVFVLPLGYVTAFFLYEYATPREQRMIKSAIDLLAGVPSVLIGSFFLLYVSPWMLRIGVYSPENLLVASLALTILALPYTASLMHEALCGVDRSLKEGALALGSTRFTAGWKVVSRASLSGILNAAVLTVNRIIGETMVVLMVAGGAAIIPLSLFDPVRPLTAAIASEMGEVELHSLHYSALFSAGLILLSFSFLLTLASRKIVGKSNGKA